VADARPAATAKKQDQPRSRPVLTLDTSGPDPRPVAPAPPPRAHPAPTAESTQAPVILRVAAQEPAFDRPASPVRRGFVDITAQPWFGHAEDHSWLSGQVLYARATDTWRLHYASLDDNDPYGGTVTLVTEHPVEGLKDGQHVRVQGSLVDADHREPGSPYRVRSFEVVEHPQ
jgi:hypothetical protein